MTRMRFSFRSAPDQLCIPILGSNPRDLDLNTFKIRRLGIAVTVPGRRVWAMRSTKGEQTRAAILEVALRMFREQGYEATTMRAIAKEAGVATGNAYYYFDSKEELIQEYYARNQAEHAAACRAMLDTETRLGPRLRGVLRALIDVQAPYHAFAAKLYKHAAEPASPLSPFSKESSPTRNAAIDLYTEVIAGPASGCPRCCAAGCRNCCGCTRWGSCCTGCTTPRRDARRPTGLLTRPRRSPSA